MFILVVIILISIYIIALENVFFLIIVSFSSSIKLLVFYDSRDVLKLEIIKVIIISILFTVGFNVYNLPV